MLPRAVIIDSSLAIILCKIGLHKLLVEIYDIILPEFIYWEITRNRYPGAEEYKKFVAEQKVQVQVSPGIIWLGRG